MICQVETESAVRPTHQKRKKQRQLQKHVKPERPQNMQMRPSLSYKRPKPQANPQEDNEKAKLCGESNTMTKTKMKPSKPQYQLNKQKRVMSRVMSKTHKVSMEKLSET